MAGSNLADRNKAAEIYRHRVLKNVFRGLRIRNSWDLFHIGQKCSVIEWDF